MRALSGSPGHTRLRDSSWSTAEEGPGSSNGGRRKLSHEGRCTVSVATPP